MKGSNVLAWKYCTCEVPAAAGATDPEWLGALECVPVGSLLRLALFMHIDSFKTLLGDSGTRTGMEALSSSL